MQFMIILMVFLSALSRAGDYRVSVVETAHSEDERRAIEALVTRLYAPLNITPSFLYYPTMRALKLVNAGELDAEAGRVEVAMEGYANVIKVDEPIFTLRAALFCLRPGDCQQGSRPAIGTIKGMLSARAFCESNNLHCSFANTRGSLTRLLSDKLVTALMLYLHEAAYTACQIPQRVLYYRMLPALELPVYHYVHKRHKALVPALSAAMQAVTAAGLATPIDKGMASLEECEKVLVELPAGDPERRH